MPKQKRKPSYLLHKATGQARVVIDGKTVYLGEYGTRESRDRYDELIAEWFAKNSADRFTLTCDLQMGSRRRTGSRRRSRRVANRQRT